MSDLPPELLRPAPPLTWRDRLAGVAESLDLSPLRLVVGLVVIAAVVVGAWHLFEAPPPPIEMELPMATSSPTPPADAAGDGPPTTSLGGGPAGPDASAPAGSEAEVVVHVAGAVAVPGVQQLPAGTRVVDAIEAAGGLAADADAGRINLAAPLQDGQPVYVPKVGEAFTGVGGAPGGGGTGGAGQDGESSVPVNLNTATAEELDDLPGVGPAIAQAIVDHRTTHGPFATVEELLEVRGIGQAKLEEIRPRVTL